MDSLITSVNKSSLEDDLFRFFKYENLNGEYSSISCKYDLLYNLSLRPIDSIISFLILFSIKLFRRSRLLPSKQLIRSIIFIPKLKVRLTYLSSNEYLEAREKRVRSPASESLPVS